MSLVVMVAVVMTATPVMAEKGGKGRVRVELAATPATITAGETSTLTWTSKGATACTATGAWSGAQPVSGSMTVAISTTATYGLTCVKAGPGGGVATASATVTVLRGTRSWTLTWTDNADGQAVVKVERRTEGTLYTQIAVTALGAIDYVDTTAVVNTGYCYRVRASNAAGDSAYATEACTP